MRYIGNTPNIPFKVILEENAKQQSGFYSILKNICFSSFWTHQAKCTLREARRELSTYQFSPVLTHSQPTSVLADHPTVVSATKQAARSLSEIPPPSSPLTALLSSWKNSEVFLQLLPIVLVGQVGC